MWKPLFSSDGAYGAVDQAASVNVFGRKADVGADETDIVDGPNFWYSTTPEKLIIESDSLDDAPGGIGLTQVRIFGLPSWADPEIYEDVDVGEETENSFVCVNWMGRARIPGAAGSSGVNQGNVTAKTSPGGVQAAVVLPLTNSTQLGGFGWPNAYRFYITSYYANLNKSTGVDVVADISVLINNLPFDNVLSFAKYHPRGINENMSLEHYFNPYAMIDGPAVLKLTIDASSAGADVTAGLMGYLLNFPGASLTSEAGGSKTIPPGNGI